jgi:hypothetical protein
MRTLSLLLLGSAGCFPSATKSEETASTPPPETSPAPTPTPVDPCLTAEGFEDCFTDAWCEAWAACGFSEPCEQTRPWTTHFESGDGSMSLDCEDIEQPRYAECLALPAQATCDELYDAAQLDNSNGPWIEVCITLSCV